MPCPFAAAPHATCVFSVINPIEGTWRVSLLYQPVLTRADEIGFRLREFLYRLKLNGLARSIRTEKFRAYQALGPEMID